MMKSFQKFSCLYIKIICEILYNKYTTNLPTIRNERLFIRHIFEQILIFTKIIRLLSWNTAPQANKLLKQLKNITLHFTGYTNKGGQMSEEGGQISEEILPISSAIYLQFDILQGPVSLVLAYTKILWGFVGRCCTFFSIMMHI